MCWTTAHTSRESLALLSLAIEIDPLSPKHDLNDVLLNSLKVTVQFERCFRLMEHISVIS